MVLLIIVFSKESLVEIKDSTCVLLTMTINPKYNTISQSRLEMYKSVVEDYLLYSNLDIHIVESSGHPNPFGNNPRIKYCTFNSDLKIDCKLCEATPYEAESILYAFDYFNLHTFENIIKITGRYFIPNLKSMILDIPNNAELFFQNNHINFLWIQEQSSEIFGCKSSILKEIMYLILENSKSNINFEHTLAGIKRNIYRFPKIKLTKPVRRGGDNRLMEYL